MTLKNALYNHSTIIREVHGGDEEFVVAIRTEAETEHHVDYLVNYQANRLRSFAAFAPVRVFDTPKALNQSDDFYGVFQ